MEPPLHPILCLLLCWSLLRPTAAATPPAPCNWRASGLSLEPGSVERVWLHCAEGTVEWLYPRGAIRFTLAPPGVAPRRFTACVKASASFHGAQLYLERDDAPELQLLLPEAEEPAGGPVGARVQCFSWLPGQEVALFLQATLQRDISRRVAGFSYQLRADWDGPRALPLSKLSMEGACRPCNDSEILMAACTSDFAVRGNIRAVLNHAETQESVIAVSATRVFHQKFTLFHQRGHSIKTHGDIKTPLRCGVRPGPGSFMFMGWVHFDEAWLGCAPRYKDFKRVYEAAKEKHENPCEITLD